MTCAGPGTRNPSRGRYSAPTGSGSDSAVSAPAWALPPARRKAPGPAPDAPGDPVPLEYSIEWLTCAFASRLDVVLVSLPGAAQDRLPAHVPDALPGREQVDDLEQHPAS